MNLPITVLVYVCLFSEIFSDILTHFTWNRAQMLHALPLKWLERLSGESECSNNFNFVWMFCGDISEGRDNIFWLCDCFSNKPCLELVLWQSPESVVTNGLKEEQENSNNNSDAAVEETDMAPSSMDEPLILSSIPLCDQHLQPLSAVPFLE